jgi:hypothetical protein
MSEHSTSVAFLEAGFQVVAGLIRTEWDQEKIDAAFTDLHSAWRLSVGIVDHGAPITTERPVWKLDQLTGGQHP